MKCEIRADIISKSILYASFIPNKSIFIPHFISRVNIQPHSFESIAWMTWHRRAKCWLHTICKLQTAWAVQSMQIENVEEEWTVNASHLLSTQNPWSSRIEMICANNWNYIFSVISVGCAIAGGSQSVFRVMFASLLRIEHWFRNSVIYYSQLEATTTTYVSLHFLTIEYNCIRICLRARCSVTLVQANPHRWIQINNNETNNVTFNPTCRIYPFYAPRLSFKVNLVTCDKFEHWAVSQWVLLCMNTTFTYLFL